MKISHGLLGLSAFALLLAGAGCAPAEAPPANDQAANTEAETSSLREVDVTDLEDGVYTLGEQRSFVQYRGVGVGKAHTGDFDVTDASVTVEEGVITDFSTTIDMTSVTNEDISNEGLRQRFIDHLLSEDFFASETYPEATITYTGAEATDEENRIDFAGNLTLRGVTDEVNGTAMLTPTEEDLVVAASFVIDRTNFDITYGSGSFFDNLGDTLIQDEVELEAVLTLVPESASDMAEEGMQDDENGTDTESVE